MTKPASFQFFTSTGPNDPHPREFVSDPFFAGTFTERVGPNHPEVRFSVGFRGFRFAPDVGVEVVAAVKEHRRANK